MKEGQKILMLTENYNIYKKLDNTILGFFVGIISGIEIEAFMNGNSPLIIAIVFNILCVLSILLIFYAMDTNTKFIQSCKDVVLNQTEYQNRENIISKLTSNTKKLQVKFKWLFWVAIVLLFVGVVTLKISFFQNLSNTSYIVYPCQQNDSIQNTHCQEHILNLDTLNIQHKQQAEIDSIHNKKSQ